MHLPECQVVSLRTTGLRRSEVNKHHTESPSVSLVWPGLGRHPWSTLKAKRLAWRLSSSLTHRGQVTLTAHCNTGAEALDKLKETATISIQKKEQWQLRDEGGEQSSDWVIDVDGRSSAVEGDARGRRREEKTEVGLKWMWMLLSPNKVFRVEPRPCQMTSSPAVVPGDCLSVYTVYTTYVSVWGLKKTGGPKKKHTAARGLAGRWFHTKLSLYDAQIHSVATGNFLSVHLFIERKATGGGPPAALFWTDDQPSLDGFISEMRSCQGCTTTTAATVRSNRCSALMATGPKTATCCPCAHAQKLVF